jgi:TatD DNase family protein
MLLVDSHCHLDFPDFEGERDAIVARAEEQGIGRLVTISTRVKKFDQILAITEEYENVFCSVGTHPHNAREERDVSAAHLERIAERGKVVAIGEAGLDFHYDNSPRDQQAESFRTHIQAARTTGLPLVIHTRSADRETAEILEEEMNKGAFKAVLHCFSAGRELAEKGVELGLYVSFSGILTFNKADELRAIARDLPMDRLLVETDAPFLAPVPNRGKRNEPAFVRHTAETLARVRGLELEEIAERTSANFFRLFDRVPAF